MADRTPIFVEVDGLNRPTGLSEFTTGDVVPVVNGGTGATSIEAATGLVYDSAAGTLTTADDVEEVTFLGGSEVLVARKIHAANDLSGNPACVVRFDGSVSATAGVSALNISATNLQASTCPVPNPVCYAQMDGDGTAGSTEINFGAGVTPVTTTDSSNQIAWNNTDKDFDITADGTYHVHATLILNVATTTVPTLKIKNGTTAKNTYAPTINGAIDPQEATIQAAFTCSDGDTISVTFDDDGSTDVNLKAGSAVMIRRLF